MIADASNVVWVDVYDPENENGAHPEAVCILRDVFEFHPLAIEDALIETHVPKVDDWGSYLYIVMHAVHFEHGKDYLETRELDVFVGPNYLVTYRTEEIDAVEQQWRVTQRDARHTRRGVDYLLYELCDAIATGYLPVMDKMDEAVDLLQDEVFGRTDARPSSSRMASAGQTSAQRPQPTQSGPTITARPGRRRTVSWKTGGP
jgi:magnesium transporter